MLIDIIVYIVGVISTTSLLLFPIPIDDITNRRGNRDIAQKKSDMVIKSSYS